MAITIRGREYVLRPLKTRDLFAVSRILRKMDIRPRVEPDSTQEQVGADLIVQVISGIGEAEGQTLAWLGGLISMPEEELAELDIDEFLAVVQALGQVPGLPDFFRKALELTQKQT